MRRMLNRNEKSLNNILKSVVFCTNDLGQKSFSYCENVICDQSQISSIKASYQIWETLPESIIDKSILHESGKDKTNTNALPDINGLSVCHRRQGRVD